MGAKYTEAQKRATAKHQAKLKNISIRVQPEYYEELKRYTDSQGVSLRSFILDAIDEKRFRELK